MKARELLKRISKKEDWGEDFAKGIVFVERELGVCIDDQYPLMKFFVQLDVLKKFKEAEQAELDRAGRR